MSARQSSSAGPSGRRRFATVAAVIGAAIVVAALYALSRSNYLFFHVLVEGFSIIVGFGTFVVAWNTRKWVSNDYLLLLGVSFLFIAIVDTFHTLAYSGMSVFPGLSSNEPTQLWVLARYIQALAFLCAPIFLTRRLKLAPIVVVLSLVTGIGLLSIFRFGTFPDAFIQGQGLTTFKIASEYLISAILVAAIVLLSRHRDAFERHVFILLVAAMATTIAAEMAFTLYTDMFGVANAIGHIFKGASFYLVYRAAVVATLATPYHTLFRDLARSRDEVQRERDLARNYLDTARVILLLLDRDGIVRLINRKGVEVLGYPAEDILGRDWFRCFLPASQQESLLDRFQRRLEDDRSLPEHVESSLVDVHGNEHVISWHTIALRDAGGVIGSTLSSGEDITAVETSRRRSANERGEVPGNLRAVYRCHLHLCGRRHAVRSQPGMARPVRLYEG